MRRSRSRVSAPGRSLLLLNWRDVWSPEGGGSELYLHEVAQRLVRDGIGVTWVTATYPGAAADETVEGIRYVRRGKHITVYLWTAWMLLRRRLGKFDAVLEVQNGMPFLARLFTRRPVTVLVHHVHREQWFVVTPPLRPLGWWLESRASVRVNRGCRYIAVSEPTRQELISLGVRAEDISLAHNGLPPAPVIPASARSSSPTLVVLSRLVPHKQIEHALRLMPAVLERFPDATLRVMGSGWWSVELENLRDELGLRDNVVFLGHVDETTKYVELSQAWLHLLPSVKEGWGLSIIEAARVGVPSLAYRSAGGVTESVLDGVTGLLVDDEASLSQAVIDLLDSPERIEEMGIKAQLRAGQFTWEAATQRIRSALFDVVTPQGH